MIIQDDIQYNANQKKNFSSLVLMQRYLSLADEAVGVHKSKTVGKHCSNVLIYCEVTALGIKDCLMFRDISKH